MVYGFLYFSEFFCLRFYIFYIGNNNKSHHSKHNKNSLYFKLFHSLEVLPCYVANSNQNSIPSPCTNRGKNNKCEVIHTKNPSWNRNKLPHCRNKSPYKSCDSSVFFEIFFWFMIVMFIEKNIFPILMDEFLHHRFSQLHSEKIINAGSEYRSKSSSEKS